MVWKDDDQSEIPLMWKNLGPFQLFDIRRKSAPLRAPSLDEFTCEFRDWRHPLRPAATAVIMVPPTPLCYSHQKVWPYSAISTSHLLENLLIDGWEHYGKWQESLYRWFSFEYICHLAGGGKDERQLSWTLDRLKDVCGQAGATLAGGKKQGVDDW